MDVQLWAGVVCHGGYRGGGCGLLQYTTLSNRIDHVRSDLSTKIDRGLRDVRAEAAEPHDDIRRTLRRRTRRRRIARIVW